LPVESEIYAGVRGYEFGEIWSRPGLDLRTRCFITIAAAAGMRNEDTLYCHMNAALNVGVTPEEVHEVLAHVSVYGGISSWEQACRVADDLFVVRGILERGDGIAIELKPAMDHDARNAATQRVLAALGGGRIGLAPDAVPLVPIMLGAGGSDSSTVGRDLAFTSADFGYGEIWGRTHRLSLRLKSFVTVALLQVMREPDQLQFHINNALNQGITHDEVQEALMQTGLYGGISGWSMAWNVAQTVFHQQGVGNSTRAD
jgi:4-carboxymuconolactone decarboxylase